MLIEKETSRAMINALVTFFSLSIVQMTSTFIQLFITCLFLSLATAFRQTEQSEFGVVHLYPPVHTEQHGANCTTDTAIIDKLLNGTGYNKFVSFLEF